MKQGIKTTLLCIFGGALVIGGISALTKMHSDLPATSLDSSITSIEENTTFSEFPFEENEIIMSADMNVLELETDMAVKNYAESYELSYYNRETKQTEKRPTTNGIWEMQIKIGEDVFRRSFHHVINDISVLNTHFEAITDTWGNNSSVVCESSQIYKAENFYSCLLNVDNFNSGCLLSKYYYNRGRFDIYAQCRIIDFGCFAFWLTGVENDENNPNHELTMELYKVNQLSFSSSSNTENYTSQFTTSDIDFTKWHKFSIDFTNANVANFLIDDQIIYTITENLPTCEYFRVNIGLLYPKTGWTGKIENSLVGSCSMRITNFDGTSL